MSTRWCTSLRKIWKYFSPWQRFNSQWKNEILGPELVTGTDSDMSTSVGNNWADSASLGTFDVDTTTADKLYMLGNGGADWVILSNTFTVGTSYRISLKVKLNAGASTTIRVGRASATATADHYFEITPTGTETTFSGDIVAGHTSFSIGLSGGFNAIAFEIDDVSVKEILA